MGAYWNVSCADKREWVDLGRLGPIKAPGVHNGQAARLVTWALMGPWNGRLVTMNCDQSPASHGRYEEAAREYEDVTERFVEEFNDGADTWTRIVLQDP